MKTAQQNTESNVYDYQTGEFVRCGTAAELAESQAQALCDGGAGVISVEDHNGPVYVQEN